MVYDLSSFLLEPLVLLGSGSFLNLKNHQKSNKWSRNLKSHSRRENSLLPVHGGATPAGSGGETIPGKAQTVRTTGIQNQVEGPNEISPVFGGGV